MKTETDLTAIRIACAEAEGWVRREDLDYTAYHNTKDVRRKIYVRNGVAFDETELSAYESDPAAALTLVEALRKEEWTFVAMSWDAAEKDDGTKGYQVTFFRPKQGIRNGEQFEAVEFSFALAIAKAFLAVRGKGGA